MNFISKYIHKRKKITKDLFYTMLAAAVGNAILQLIVYPITARQFGVDTVGYILFFIAIIYIVPQAIGTSISNTRLLTRKDFDTTNGDYSAMLMIGASGSFLICATVSFIFTGEILFSLFFGLFSVIYMFKIYAGVEFRLRLDFKGFFIYYLISAIGYLIGLVLYIISDIWLLIFFVGEGAAVFYVIIRRNILKKDQKKVPFKKIAKTAFTFMWALLVRDCVDQFDRIIIMPILSATSVTQYHVVSVIAKTMQLFVTPLSTLMMTYMTQRDWKMTKKVCIKIVIGCVSFGIIFYGICLIITPIYIKIFYPQLYDSVIQYNFIINLGLIIMFVSSLLNVILMSQGELKIFSTIQTIWGFSYIIIAYFAVTSHGLWGLAYAAVAVNSLRFVLLLVVSFWKMNRGFNNTGNKDDVNNG